MEPTIADLTRDLNNTRRYANYCLHAGLIADAKLAAIRAADLKVWLAQAHAKALAKAYAAKD